MQDIYFLKKFKKDINILLNSYKIAALFLPGWSAFVLLGTLPQWATDATETLFLK